MLHTPPQEDPCKCLTMSHHFAAINVKNKLNGTTNPLLGVMRFLRDAFLDASCRSSKNIFLIDSLTGFNDFSIYFELEAFTNETTLSPFAQALIGYRHAIIPFTEVIITTQGQLGKSSNDMCIEISFILDSNAWNMRFFGEPKDFYLKNNWNFTNQSFAAHQNSYFFKEEKPWAAPS